MFLSIVIPVYNAEKYLAECLNSCLNQNISSSEYEIICINDGSSDKSGDILKQYSERYSNIIVVNKKMKAVVLQETRVWSLLAENIFGLLTMMI